MSSKTKQVRISAEQHSALADIQEQNPSFNLQTITGMVLAMGIEETCSTGLKLTQPKKTYGKTKAR
jgi:hypothetical protein